MNDTIQTILALTALGLALSFLIKKFFWKKPKAKKAFSDAHDCDKCH
ncbi:FeoB-associated Cys-rich membrane protein [Gelidibacter salicanalis]|uniref:FeoB-associated Cys-rich membrane protein n=1 Tax=Gelidibacter salicanalis TaxID=291193 RepID=A0A5C7ALR6_9FLAO|nr:FeoB-associated Cys-rich membrane protein [Gelidibacter sp. F2691]TXE08543.1 FeoB-associated Cys-rich membrane protein [Gelidibacter salicanalis]